MLPMLAATLLMALPPRPVLDLWPAGLPDSWSRGDKEETVHQPGESFAVVKNVSHPTLEIFRAPHAKPHAPTVIVCPGGGYYVEAIEHEGVEIAERLNGAGIHAAVLKYRLPNRDADKPLRKAPLQDAQRTIRVLRARAAEYCLDPARIGIMGFSAGGHLAAVASNAPKATYSPTDDADRLSPQPDFTILIYPAYLDTDGKPALNDTVHLTSAAPPAFVVQTMDDSVGVENAFAYALACRAEKVPVELHVFPKGGHGYGLRTKEPGLSGWMDLLIAWTKRTFPA